MRSIDLRCADRIEGEIADRIEGEIMADHAQRDTAWAPARHHSTTTQRSNR